MEQEILTILDQYKTEHNIPDDLRLARHLNISGAELSRVRHGKRRMGAKFLRLIMAHCPEIRLDIAQILAKGGDAGR